MPRYRSKRRGAPRRSVKKIIKDCTVHKANNSGAVNVWVTDPIGPDFLGNFAEHYAKSGNIEVEDHSYVKKQLCTRWCEIQKAAKANLNASI